jgi:hypothetical protein
MDMNERELGDPPSLSFGETCPFAIYFVGRLGQAPELRFEGLIRVRSRLLLVRSNPKEP